MNGWLVLARSNLDDIPLQLCETEQEARSYAEHVNNWPENEAANVMRVDASGPICISILEFKNGCPQSIENIKEAP